MLYKPIEIYIIYGKYDSYKMKIFGVPDGHMRIEESGRENLYIRYRTIRFSVKRMAMAEPLRNQY